jgi:hypothetical protein
VVRGIVRRDSNGTQLQPKVWEHMKTAKALMYTCWQMYQRNPTGLAPEYVDFLALNDIHVAKKVPLSCMACMCPCVR